MRKYLMLGLFVALLFSAGLVLAAKPDTTLVPVANDKSGVSVVIPAHAVEVAPGVFSLGMTIDEGRVVEGYAIVAYKDAPAKPGTVCGNGICEPGENTKKCPADCAGGEEAPDASNCYGFLAKGAKWRNIEPYVVNPSNAEGLDAAFITSNLATDIGKWETAAGVDILGAGSETNETLAADMVSTDGRNEVYFGDVGHEGAIAITVVWGIFGGPPFARELVEWDQVYDQVDFDWSATGEAGKMDFENIATHELGHTFGLDDLYDDKCSVQTMYGYAGYGETEKRSLESGDIAGVRKLYS